MVAHLLDRLGFIVSLKRSQPEPTQFFTYLELCFNTKDMIVSLPQDKVLAIKAQVAKVPQSLYTKGDESTGSDTFCQNGTSSGKITLASLAVLAKGNLQG